MAKKIIGVTMVKNEADIIEASLRHNLQVLDSMIVYDHYSSDGTDAIVEKLIEEGLAIDLRRADDANHNQPQVITRLMCEAFEKAGADVVLALDADEMLVSADNKTHPRETLEALEEGPEYWIDWRTYVVDAEDEAAQLNPAKRITMCSDEVFEGCSKVAVTRELALKHRPRVDRGNHQLLLSKRVRKKIGRKLIDGLSIAHYPMRSVDQLYSKIINGWINSLSRPDLGVNEAIHWRKLVQRIVENKEALGLDDLREFTAQAYLPCGDIAKAQLRQMPVAMPWSDALELKYTPESLKPYIGNVVENAQNLAKQYGQLRRRQSSVRYMLWGAMKTLGWKIAHVVCGRICGMQRYKSKYRDL